MIFFFFLIERRKGSQFWQCWGVFFFGPTKNQSPLFGRKTQEISFPKSFSRHFHGFFRLPTLFLQGIFSSFYPNSSLHFSFNLEFVKGCQKYISPKVIGSNPILFSVQVKSSTCITSLLTIVSVQLLCGLVYYIYTCWVHYNTRICTLLLLIKM